MSHLVCGSTGQLGFWFDKILRNSVYLLLENPDYTLVEVPLLLREDTTFRNSLIDNVTVKPFIRDFAGAAGRHPGGYGRGAASEARRSR